jgi:Repeat of unknown function (DUF5648)
VGLSTLNIIYNMRSIKCLISLSCLLLLLACGEAVINTSEIPNIKEKRAFSPSAAPTVYRFTRSSTGAFFYTGSEQEALDTIRNFPDLRYDGPAFEQDALSDFQPIYRFANTINGGYFYTGSAAERDATITEYPHLRYEGISFYMLPMSAPNSIPVFRLVELSTGYYFYTSRVDEKDFLSSNAKWRFEGASFATNALRPLAASGPFNTGTQVIDGILGDTASRSETASVKVDNSGRSLAVFNITINGVQRVKASHSNASQANTNWTSAQLIDEYPATPTGFIVTTGVDLVMSANGNATASWEVSAPCNLASTLRIDLCRYIATRHFNTTSASWTALELSKPFSFLSSRRTYITDENHQLQVFSGAAHSSWGSTVERVGGVWLAGRLGGNSASATTYKRFVSIQSSDIGFSAAINRSGQVAVASYPNTLSTFNVPIEQNRIGLVRAQLHGNSDVTTISGTDFEQLVFTPPNLSDFVRFSGILLNSTGNLKVFYFLGTSSPSISSQIMMSEGLLNSANFSSAIGLSTKASLQENNVAVNLSRFPEQSFYVFENARKEIRLVDYGSQTVSIFRENKWITGASFYKRASINSYIGSRQTTSDSGSLFAWIKSPTTGSESPYWYQYDLNRVYTLSADELRNFPASLGTPSVFGFASEGANVQPIALAVSPNGLYTAAMLSTKNANWPTAQNPSGAPQGLAATTIWLTTSRN